MILEGGAPIQAFPATPGTYVGTPSSFTAKGYSLLHAAEDVTVHFYFSGTNELIMDLPAGMDIAIDPQCETITATGKVWIS